MRIGVYTIALNEAKFVDTWARATEGADYRLVADTGSTDDTVKRLKDHRINVRPISVKPWRFDDARNAALAMMPADLDVVIALDMDEVLVGDWRRTITDNWTPNCTRLRYRYVWSWTADQRADVMYYDVKITTRHGWRWRYAVHEVLYPTLPDVMVTYDGILVEHHPDYTKSRGQYLPLLELAVQEDRHDTRCKYLLAREYFALSRYVEAIQHFEEYLAMPGATWYVERGAAMRQMAKSLEILDKKGEAYVWFVRATVEDPNSREILIDTARFMSGLGRHHAAIDYAERAVAVGDEMSPQQDERYAREEGPYDIMAVAYFSLGDHRRAVEMAEKAVSLNPTEERLTKNLKTMLDNYNQQIHVEIKKAAE